MKKTIIKTINGRDIEMTHAQSKELERDGMVIVGDRIIRSASYIHRVHKGAADSIIKTAKKVFQ